MVCIYQHAPIFAGEHIYKANPKIIAALTEAGKLWAHVLDQA